MNHMFEPQGTVTIGDGDPLFIQVCSGCGKRKYTIGRKYTEDSDCLSVKETTYDTDA